jgi:hypothetical protein
VHEKRVYTEVSNPVGITPLPSKFVLTIKRDELGHVEKYKARLVAKGFKQAAGQDYDEVFAPTVQHVTLRIRLATASHKGLDIGQLDVKTAFLNGDPPGDIYLKLPNEVRGMVWKLHKALCGLKQAARAWHAKLRDAMIDHGFVPSMHEPCLFLRGTGSNRVYVMVHVDDALLVGSTQALRDAKRDMQKMFDTKDIGDARHFLGMTITRHEDGS